MPNLSEATYERTHAEVVEFVDRSVHVAQTMPRGMVNQQVKPDWEMYPDERRIVCKMLLTLHQPTGDLILKLSVRCEYNVSIGEGGPRDIAGLPREIYMTLAHETWDYMMKYVHSRKTPIASIQIPPPPDDILGSGNVYGMSMN